MKKTLLLLLFFLWTPAQAQQIVLDIPDEEIKIVENDVPKAEQWIRDAWLGKLLRCRERLANKEKARLITEAAGKAILIPADDATLAEKALERPDYQNREERDAAEAIQVKAEEALPR